ncbi:hypothetical protein H7U19_01345 [Hyunsoonleella sp. SJ7]|uniref:Bulb-type lectin domain-containing protein n=1 Tax=Hyunsoonleella aquatilis TaxID=2762758 RepID=A0A923H776_9FLAO|nr:hypothetical protein [Hyunsoonleella aquatilis]MBC3757030.1 hypothetical protein [Hyunsoonleella aquatilis]
MKNFKIKTCAIIWIVLMSFFNCSQGDVTSEEKEEKTEENHSGLALVDQVSLSSADDEFGIDIIATDNGYIICGVANEERPYLIAIDKNLNVIWEKNLGTSGVGGFERIIKTKDGNYVATGFTEVTGNDLDLDVYAVKINDSGEILWENTFNFNYITDTTMDMIEASNGDIVIAGSKLTEPLPASIFDAKKDILVVRIDAGGDLVWSNTFGEVDSNEGLSSIIEDSNGDFLIGGSLSVEIPSNNGSIVTTSESDVLLLRVNSDGQLLTRKTLGSSESDGAARLHKLSNGQIVVLSASSGSDQDVIQQNKGEQDIWLFSIDSNLNITNQASFGGVGMDYASRLIEKSNGELLLIGDTNSHLITASNAFASSDVWILRLSSAFTVLDEITIGGSDYDGASGAILDSDDNLVVVGSSVSTDGDVVNNMGNWDIWVTFIKDFE